MGIQINGQTHTVTPLGGDTLHVGGDLIVPGLLSYDDVTSIDSIGIVTSRNIVFSGSTGTAGQFVIRRDSDGANIGQFRSDAGTNDISIGNGGSGSLILKTGANTERLRITAGGSVGIGTDNPSNLLHVYGQSRFEDYLRGSSTHNKLYIADDVAITATKKLYLDGGSNTYIDEVSADTLRFSTTGTERLRIDNVGSAQFTGQNSPSGRNTRISRYGSLLVATTGEILSDARCSIDSGNGNIATEGSVVASSVNLQSSSTNSWFQTGTSLYSTHYVWAAKNSSSNTWHSGLQTDGDLLLGNVLNDARIGIYGSSGNMGLKNATTSAKLNVSTDISGNYTGWKERNVASGSMSQASIDSKTPTINDFTYPNSSNGMLIWSTSKIGFAAGGESPQYGTGVQMLFDSAGLMLGGNRAFDRTSSTSTSTNWNLKLNTAGSGIFKGQLEADPFLLDANDSWVKSTYGGISNSTVSSLNNFLIGQNMRGWIGTRDGGSPTNNFHHIVTHGGIGYCGTEYCYGGITKFYNNGGGTTANATFTPNETVRFDSSGLTVNNGLRISTTSGGSALANPYSLGALASATIPSYPHFTGVWVVTGSVPCNNTWYDLLHSFSDSNGTFHGYSGDASSKNLYLYQYSITSPAYGVNNLIQRHMTGAWNTGSVSFQLRNNSGAWTLQIKATSHYSSSNNAGFRIMFNSYY